MVMKGVPDTVFSEDQVIYHEVGKYERDTYFIHILHLGPLL